MVRILASQGIPIPAPMSGSVHSIRVTLGFVDIAFDEVRPKRMAGYGEVVSRLLAYLAQGESDDLEQRLRRLEQAGNDIYLVKALERAIGRHGLVEFRPALRTIIDRLEGDSFEIAVFGRVSSGKSSLLNHIVGQNVLPVGVNPITAVPTVPQRTRREVQPVSANRGGVRNAGAVCQTIGLWTLIATMFWWGRPPGLLERAAAAR